MKIGRETETQNSRNVAQMEDAATKAMLQNGLVINDITQQQEQEWIDDVNRAMPQLLGKQFNRELYNDIQTVLKNIRN
jgi:TRAP-type C4-dicarboxylate transport system substrate-binding protein